MLSADNPASREPMTLERLAELPHVIIALTGDDARDRRTAWSPITAWSGA